jgi:WLM domain
MRASISSQVLNISDALLRFLCYKNNCQNEKSQMQTDTIPRISIHSAEYMRSDALHSIGLPSGEGLRELAVDLKIAMKTDDRKEVQSASAALITEMANAFMVVAPPLKVLNARPRKVTENYATETFGDYDFNSTVIRLWMRTAVQKKTTSYGTLLSTLCHEFCHHLDVVALELPHTYHTRGFYERAAILYHHVQNTPVRSIIWNPHRDGTFSVDWARTMKR